MYSEWSTLYSRVDLGDYMIPLCDLLYFSMFSSLLFHDTIMIVSILFYCLYPPIQFKQTLPKIFEFLVGRTRPRLGDNLPGNQFPTHGSVGI